jgi:hypothetical protein
MILLSAGGPVSAHPGDQPQNPPLDFVTGGGFIVRPSGAKAEFSVSAGVKHGAFFGHLEYKDKGNGLRVKARREDITGYIFIDANTRDICGRADTNLAGQVAFHIRVTDARKTKKRNGDDDFDDKFDDDDDDGDRSGDDDIFIIRLGKNGSVVYTTEGDPDHTLGGPRKHGGNIQLHKGNRSNTAPANPSFCEI